MAAVRASRAIKQKKDTRFERAPVVLEYLNAMNIKQASDLYLTVGFPPTMRIEGILEIFALEPMTFDEINEILAAILTNRQRREFENPVDGAEYLT